MQLFNVFFTLAMAITAVTAAPTKDLGPIQKGNVILPPKSYVLKRLEREGASFAGWSLEAKLNLEQRYWERLNNLRTALRRRYGPLEAMPEDVKLKAEQKFWQQFRDKLKDIKVNFDWRQAQLNKPVERNPLEREAKARAKAEKKARVKASGSAEQLRKELKSTREALAENERWARWARHPLLKQRDAERKAELEREIAELEELLEQAERREIEAAAGRKKQGQRSKDKGGAGATGADKPSTSISTSSDFSKKKSAQPGQLPRPSELVLDGGLGNLLKGGAAAAAYGGYEALRRIPGIGGFGLPDKVLSF